LGANCGSILLWLFVRHLSSIHAGRKDHFLQADFPLLIVVSERKITSEWPTIRADQLRRNIRKPADLIRRP
jgi:hypothetical protein